MRAQLNHTSTVLNCSRELKMFLCIYTSVVVDITVFVFCHIWLPMKTIQNTNTIMNNTPMQQASWLAHSFSSTHNTSQFIRLLCLTLFFLVVFRRQYNDHDSVYNKNISSAQQFGSTHWLNNTLCGQTTLSGYFISLIIIHIFFCYILFVVVHLRTVFRLSLCIHWIYFVCSFMD